MTEQLSMPLWPRQHDLPPRWDGMPVEWSEWKSEPFICPLPKDKRQCGECSSHRQPMINLGRIWTDPSTAPRAISRGRLAGGRHLVAMLTAFRCEDCEHDTVLVDDELWDLDPTDYTDDGSWAVG